MSTIVNLRDIVDRETGLSGMVAVHSRCAIPKRVGNGTVKDMINVYTEYTDGHIALPLAVAQQLTTSLNLVTLKQEELRNTMRTPKPEQVEIISLMFKYLEEKRGVMLDCDPGMGKTFMSLWVGLSYRVKIAVVVARADYAKQWANELCAIYPQCASKICVMGSITEKDPQFPATPGDAHYLFIRAGLIKTLKPKDAAKYRYIVLDETHLLGTPEQLQGILRFVGASWVVGCSGTPEKPDGRHRTIECFLHSDTVIKARKERPIDFVLCNVNTFTSEKKYDELLRASMWRDAGVGPGAGAGASSGHMGEYTRMELSLASDPVTTNRIALVAYSLVRTHKHKVLVMSKIVHQCEMIKRTLEAWGVRATTYHGKRKGYDGFAEVTIGTTQVCMTAYDQATSGIAYDRRYTAAILCQSLAQDGNLWQGIGRIMRAPDHENPVFVWIQYPMGAYQGHTNAMIAAMTERKLRISDHTKIISEHIYQKCLAERREVEILRMSPIVYPEHVIYQIPEE